MTELLLCNISIDSADVPTNKKGNWLRGNIFGAWCLLIFNLYNLIMASHLNLKPIKNVSSDAVPDSFPDAKELLRECLINVNPGDTLDYLLIEEILQKHPDLVHCEYKQEISNPWLELFEKEQDQGFYGTPLVLACEQHGYDESKFSNSY